MRFQLEAADEGGNEARCFRGRSPVSSPTGFERGGDGSRFGFGGNDAGFDSPDIAILGREVGVFVVFVEARGGIPEEGIDRGSDAGGSGGPIGSDIIAKDSSEVGSAFEGVDEDGVGFDVL